MIILGIDPGFSVTGFAIVKQENNKSYLIDCGYLQMSFKKSLSGRIGIFYNTLKEKIEKFESF